MSLQIHSKSSFTLNGEYYDLNVIFHRLKGKANPHRLGNLIQCMKSECQLSMENKNSPYDTVLKRITKNVKDLKKLTGRK